MIRKNTLVIYTCSDQHVTRTLTMATGIIPATIVCSDCKKRAKSDYGNNEEVDKTHTHVLYRPNPSETIRKNYQKHVKSGGLLLATIEDYAIRLKLPKRPLNSPFKRIRGKAKRLSIKVKMERGY